MGVSSQLKISFQSGNDKRIMANDELITRDVPSSQHRLKVELLKLLRAAQISIV